MEPRISEFQKVRNELRSIEFKDGKSGFSAAEKRDVGKLLAGIENDSVKSYVESVLENNSSDVYGTPDPAVITGNEKESVISGRIATMENGVKIPEQITNIASQYAEEALNHWLQNGLGLGLDGFKFSGELPDGLEVKDICNSVDYADPSNDKYGIDGRREVADSASMDVTFTYQGMEFQASVTTKDLPNGFGNECAQTIPFGL